MSLLNPCITQIDKYSFKVVDITTDQTYDTTGIDLSTVTAAKLVFKNLFDNTTYEIDILSDWAYVLADGLTINITSFPDGLMSGYDYFPDWMYQITIVYTYNSVEYSKARTVGFRTIISTIVFQQLQQSDWVKTLKCGCGCEKYSTSFRKFNFLDGLEIASANCLITQYTEILTALYKLTGTVHEYS